MKKILFLFLSLLITLVQGFSLPVKAAAEYDSQWVAQSPYLTLVPGQEADVWVEFKNTGLAIWYQSGFNPVHLGTANPVDHSSQFYEQTTWLNSNRIELSQIKVGPGDVGRFSFKIKAPYTSGVYKEYFRPVAEDKTWMKDEGVYWEFRVVGSNGYEEMCLSKDSSTQSVSGSGCKLPEAWMYDSRWTTQSPYVKMYPGQTADAWVEFTNDGTASWNQSGDYALHLGTSNPLDRESLFADTSWLSDNRIIMDQSRVNPGEKAKFSFKLKAPNTLGVYHEYFRPVVENISWLNDEGVYWTVEVVAKDQVNPTFTPTPTPTVSPSISPIPTPTPNNNDMTNLDYSAKLIAQTGVASFYNGDTSPVQLTVSYKNTGKKAWNKTGTDMAQLATSQPNDRNSGFNTSTWLNTHRIAMKQSVVNPGETADFIFTVAPGSGVGDDNHQEHFMLNVNGNWLTNTEVLWQIVVSSKVSGDVLVTADGNFDVIDGVTKQTLTSLTAGQLVDVNYSGGTYLVKAGSKSFSGNNFIRVVAKNNSILQVKSYNDIKSWDSSINDNLFRDTIEIHYSSNAQALWVINELPIEDYLAGVAETNDSSSTEFLKTMVVVERSYAVYHVDRGGRHPQNFSDLYNSVNGNGDDQVYRGYAYEKRNPLMKKAVGDTKGMVVEYQGKVAVTPYFSHSDGRTRSFEEVWGSKDYPYCVSVDDPYNKGMSLLGHGVGMSALGAMMFIDKENKTYDWVLKYYYKGIDIGNVSTSSKRIRVGIYSIDA